MTISSLSPCIVVQNIAEAKAFYERHFGARVTFDCGWYVNLALGESGATVQFMQPRGPEQAVFPGQGLTYNLAVDDVDAVHARLAAAGLPVVMPLEDHPWGDRGFATLDPNGVVLYIYTGIAPSEEYRQYHT